MQGLSGAKYRSELVWIAYLRFFLIPAEFSEVIDQYLRKRKTRLGKRFVSVLTDVALCEGQDCQSPAIHQRENCGPGYLVLNVTSCHIVPHVVQQLIVEIGQCTVRPQNSRHHCHPNRNIHTGHHKQCDCEWCYYRPNRRTARKHVCCQCHFAGSNQQLLLVYGILHLVWSDVRLTGLCVPGTKRPVKRIRGHGADSPAAEHWLCEPRSSCVLRNMSPCHGACERKLRVNAPKCSRNCGRLQLVLVTQVGTQIGSSHDRTTGLQLRNLLVAVTDWSVPLHPKVSSAPGDTSRTVWRLGFSSGSSISRTFGVLGYTYGRTVSEVRPVLQAPARSGPAPGLRPRLRSIPGGMSPVSAQQGLPDVLGFSLDSYWRDYFVRAVLSNGPGRHWPPGAQQGRLFTPPTMVEPLLIARW